METPDPVIQQDPQDAEKDKLAYVEDFLKELRQNWQNSNAALGKALTVSLLLAFSFELLSRAAIAEASLGPFKLKDLSLIRKALPVLLAYYSYDILVNLGRVFQFEALHDTLLRALHPKVSTSAWISSCNLRATRS